MNIVCILSASLAHAHCRVVDSFLLQHWKIFSRQSNEKIRLQLVCPSSHNNLPLPLYFSVAGAALMDISEVHKRVHLELEENVSAKTWRESLVYTLFRKTASQLLLCSCTCSPLQDAVHVNLLLCMVARGTVFPFLQRQPLLS